VLAAIYEKKEQKVDQIPRLLSKAPPLLSLVRISSLSTHPHTVQNFPHSKMRAAWVVKKGMQEYFYPTAEILWVAFLVAVSQVQCTACSANWPTRRPSALGVRSLRQLFGQCFVRRYVASQTWRRMRGHWSQWHPCFWKVPRQICEIATTQVSIITIQFIKCRN
jgi:hypothetical protein